MLKGIFYSDSVRLFCLLAGTVVVTDKAADEMAAPCHVSLAKQKRKRNFISAEKIDMG